jgi:2'-5' RNA ligase
MAAGDERNEREHAGSRPRRVRAFIALAPPPATVETIAAWQRRALDDRDELRAIGADGLHLTLAFLGDRDEDEIGRAREALLAAAASPAPVPVAIASEPIGLPRRRPRVVAFAAASPDAISLHEALVARLATAGLARPDRRPFRPHLSVARVRGDPGRGRRRAAVAGLPVLGPTGHTFDAVRVALYRSQLRSQGARYSILADVDLPRSGS